VTLIFLSQYKTKKKGHLEFLVSELELV